MEIFPSHFYYRNYTFYVCVVNTFCEAATLFIIGTTLFMYDVITGCVVNTFCEAATLF